MRGSKQYTFNPVAGCNKAIQLGFALLATTLPAIALGATTAPTIANNTFASTAVGGSLTQTVTLTLTSVETITSITIQPTSAEYAIQSITGCKTDGTTQSSVGAVCDVSIKYTPQLPGNTISPTFARNATLLFTDSNSNSFAYGLTGAATGPVAKVVPGKVALYAGVQQTGLNALDLGMGLVTAGYGGDGGPATSATFNLSGATADVQLLTQPLALDSVGNLYVADAGNYVIRKIDNTPAHKVTTIAGTPTVTGTSAGSGGLATSATLPYPHALVVDAAGNIFFLDAASQYSYYGIVYRIDAATHIITALGGQLYNPADGYNSAGGGTCNTTLGTPGFYECGDGGMASYASLPYPRNLAIDASGNLYVWENGGYIRKIVPSTGIITTYATAAQFPSDVMPTPSFALGGMTLASDGNFYVLVDAGLYEFIYELNTSTQAVTVVAGGQDPNYTGSCDSAGTVNGNSSAPYVDIAAGQAGYPGPQLFVFTNGSPASTGDLTSDASGNIYYSGAQCNTADTYDYRPAVFRINLPTNTVYLEMVGGSSGTATSNYGAYTGFNIAPQSAIPDGNGNIYFTTNNQVGFLSASAGALDFGQQNEFTTGITRIATYENVGNSTDTNPTYSLQLGLNFTDVSSADTSACNLLTQVGVNKTCNIDYSFTPTQPNNVTDTINLAEAASSNPGFGLTTNAQTVTLTGDANPEAQFVVTPPSLNFGNVTVGQSSTLTFTVSNANGAVALGLYGIYVFPSGALSPPTEYTLGGTCNPSSSNVSVAAGDSCTVTVTFTPTDVASYPTTLTINNSVTNPEGATFAITGAGVSASTPTATLTPPTLGFGNQAVSTTSTAQTLTLSNTSTSSMNITGITIGGANPTDFAKSTTCGSTLAANSTCMISVTFTPASATTFGATVSVADNANGSPQSTTLTGTGTAATPTATLSPPALSFGSQTVNTSSATQTVTLTNTSSTTLNISGVSIGGANTADFSKTTTCGSTLAANSACTITVTFTPLSATNFTATVSVADDATGSPQTTTLSGTGTTPTTSTATLSPNPLVLSTVAVYSYSQGTATLTNTGSATITNIVASITGTNASEFTIYPNGTCGSTLAVGASCTYTINFNPPSAGIYAATLSVADSASGSPQTIALSAIGLPAPASQVQFNPTELNVIAGTGTMPTNCVNPAEPGPALQTQLCGPSNVAGDAAGNIYIVEQDENVVKKLDTSGNITNFAGTENSGPGSFSGDDGPANMANLSAPDGIALDGLGNVYIADYGNGRIREVNAATGIITTFIGGAAGQYFNGGTGTSVVLSPGGIAFDPSGNLFIAEPNQQIVVKVTPLGVASLFAGEQTTPGGPGSPGFSGDGGQATSAQLDSPTSVASDRAGNIYISDYLNYRIRYVNENFDAGTISTFAGNGTKGDTGDGDVATSAEISPSSIAMNEADDLFISDGTTIRKIDGQGNITTFAGGGSGALGGPATATALQNIGQPGIDYLGDVILPVTSEVLSAGPKGILQFGNQAVGTTSAPLTITVENTGNNFLNFTNMTYTPTGDFSVTGGTCEGYTDGGWTPGQTCTLTITFTPTTAGTLTGSVSVPSNSTGSPATIVLSGTGTATSGPTATLAPNTLSFSAINVAATATAQVVTLSNTGNAVLNISGITIVGTNPSDFAKTTTCGATLAAGANCTISVTFTPASAANFTATVSVADNASNSPQTVTLTGTGTTPPAPIASLAPSTLTFASTVVGATTTAQTLTLSNTGNAVLNLTGIMIAGTNPSDFADTTTCGATLAAGSNCTISVTFTPASIASFTATVSVADNATGSPQTATLSGAGIAAPDFSVAASPPTQAVSGGSVATYNITVGSLNGDFGNPVTLTATGVPAGATATFTPASVTPGGESAPSVMAIQTTPALAQLHRPGRWPWMSTITLAFCIPLMCWRRRTRMRLLSTGLLFLLFAVGTAMISGCGGGYYAQPPSQTYTITVIGTSGSTQHSTTVTLTVQ